MTDERKKMLAGASRLTNASRPQTRSAASHTSLEMVAINPRRQSSSSRRGAQCLYVGLLIVCALSSIFRPGCDDGRNLRFVEDIAAAAVGSFSEPSSAHALWGGNQHQAAPSNVNVAPIPLSETAPHFESLFGPELHELIRRRFVDSSVLQEPIRFAEWSKSLPVDDYARLVRSVETAAYSVELVQFLNRAGLSYSLMKFESASFQPHPHTPRILIAVTAAPEMIGRVAAIARTWGEESVLPPNVLVRYYFGRDETNATALAERAGIQDVSQIVLMPGVDDVEYPNTKKGAAVFRHMHELSEGLRSGVNIDWFFDADDDSYVNVPNLIRFVSDKDPTEPQYIGRPVTGSPENMANTKLFEPYCNGGPGFILSRSTLRTLAEKYAAFLPEADAIDMAQWEDVRVGAFLYKTLQIGCFRTRDWEFKDKRFPKRNPFVDAIDSYSVASHPFKTEGSMEKHHKWLKQYMAKTLTGIKRENLHAK